MYASLIASMASSKNYFRFSDGIFTICHCFEFLDLTNCFHLNALHLYCMLAILAPQWQGGNTSPCHCEAGIPSLGVPPVKITPNRVKYSKLHSRWCNFPSLTRRVLHKARRCCPRQQDSPPRPKTPPDMPCAYDHFGPDQK